MSSWVVHGFSSSDINFGGGRVGVTRRLFCFEDTRHVRGHLAGDQESEWPPQQGTMRPRYMTRHGGRPDDWQKPSWRSRGRGLGVEGHVDRSFGRQGRTRRLAGSSVVSMFDLEILVWRRRSVNKSVHNTSVHITRVFYVHILSGHHTPRDRLCAVFLYNICGFHDFIKISAPVERHWITLIHYKNDVHTENCFKNCGRPPSWIWEHFHFWSRDLLYLHAIRHFHSEFRVDQLKTDFQYGVRPSRYSDKAIFKMAAVRHLEFSKFGILVIRPVLEGDSALSYKISR